MRRGCGGAWRAALRLVSAGFLLCAVLVTGACTTQATGRPLATAPTGTPTGTGTGLSPVPSAPPAAPRVNRHRELQIRTTVDWYLSHLTLDQKLGQMFLIETVWQHYNSDVDAMVRQMYAGAMIVYKQNMGSPSQLRQYLADVQANAPIPIMISMDEEGGGVDRLGYAHYAPALPSAASLAATGSPAEVYKTGARAAQQMLDFGINTDLAPVADVRTAPNAIEWDRIFGDDPATVVRFAGAFLDGLQSNGVIGCVKHWPGIGSVTKDPHETLPTITRSRAELQATEFAAFKGMLKHAPGMIMVTHVLVPAIDPRLPATLSPALVNDVLRGELGYDGVVMTDSLYMKGISLHYNLPQAAVLAVMAGVDLLEGAYDNYSMRAMRDAIKAAMQDGRISRARIDQSVRRILTLKARYGLLPLRDLPRGPVQEVRGVAVAPPPAAEARRAGYSL